MFAERRRCTRGKSCGASCISKNKVCRKDLSSVSKSLVEAKDSIQRGRELRDNRTIKEKLKDSLPKFKVETSSDGNALFLSRTVDGAKIGIILFNDKDIALYVNGSPASNKNLPYETGKKIAIQVKRATTEIFKAVPEGTTFAVRASTMDGRGEQRTRAYSRAGFSKVDTPGSIQVGKVVNGKLKPSTIEEYRLDKETLKF